MMNCGDFCKKLRSFASVAFTWHLPCTSYFSRRASCLRLPSLRPSRLRCCLTGLLCPLRPLFGSHGDQGPLAADLSAPRALLSEELENVGWQSFHSDAHLNPVLVNDKMICYLKGV